MMQEINPVVREINLVVLKDISGNKSGSKSREK